MDNNDNSIASQTNVFLVIRLLLGVALSLLCFTQLFFTFRGLDQPAAMDQAQIARQIARGEGMTTKNLAPFDIRIRSQASETGLDFNHYEATSYAPLHPAIMAVAIRVTGYHNFGSKRMVPDQEMVYDGDRVIATVSTLFFALALVLSYILLRNCRSPDGVQQTVAEFCCQRIGAAPANVSFHRGCGLRVCCYSSRQ